VPGRQPVSVEVERPAQVSFSLLPAHASCSRKADCSSTCRSNDPHAQLGVVDESQPSPEGVRKELHLQLVFFDLLELDGKSLIEKPYEDRRATLERLIRIIPGWSMLAARSPVHLSRGLLPATKVRLRSYLSVAAIELTTSTPQELEAAFSASAERFEGAQQLPLSSGWKADLHLKCLSLQRAWS
jgi:hypothetical protein